jgi:hypothetical protein
MELKALLEGEADLFQRLAQQAELEVAPSPDAPGAVLISMPSTLLQQWGPILYDLTARYGLEVYDPQIDEEPEGPERGHLPEDVLVAVQNAVGSLRFALRAYPEDAEELRSRIKDALYWLDPIGK